MISTISEAWLAKGLPLGYKKKLLAHTKTYPRCLCTQEVSGQEEFNINIKQTFLGKAE